MPWQIFVIMDTVKKVQVTVSEDCLISELLKKIIDHPHIPKGTSYRLYTSDGTSIQDNKDNENRRLSDYNMTDKSTVNLSVGLAGGVWPTREELEGRPRNPKPSGRIRLTSSTTHPDVCGLDDENPRVMMPCGHAIAPLSLALHCLHELENKKHEISCPGSKCDSTWPFSLVREAACLSDNETTEFERKLLTNRRNAEVKQCPNCFINCHRYNDKDKRVGCLDCKSRGRENYEFCWHCLREWRNSGIHTCGNSGCDDTSGLFRILAECNNITLLGVNCPSVRACPNCSLIIEHIRGCKHMICKGCNYNFCFMCLETHDWRSQSLQPCVVAPRQTPGVKQKPPETPAATSSRRSLQSSIAAGYQTSGFENLFGSTDQLFRPWYNNDREHNTPAITSSRLCRKAFNAASYKYYT